MSDFHWEIDDSVMRQLIENTPERLDQWLGEVADIMNTEIVNSFGSSPSAPGDPPGVDSGDLKRSMKAEKDGDLRYVIHDGVEYGVYLELGTEKMEPRPFIVPVFEEWQTKISEDARNVGLFDG